MLRDKRYLARTICMGLAPNKGTKAVLLPRTSVTNAQVTCRQHRVCGGKICCLGQALGMGIKCKQNTVLCT